MKNQKRQTGFTLIELMIVIAIIGILMAYAIPAYRDYTTRAKAGECVSMMNGAKVGVSERWNTTNDLAGITSNATAFVANASSIQGANVKSVTVGDAGKITCLFSSDDNDLDTHTVSLTPSDASGGSLTWTCTNTGLATPHIPAGCS